MKRCNQCNIEKKNREFNKDNFDDYVDICRECEQENIMDEDERDGWQGLIDKYSDD